MSETTHLITPLLLLDSESTIADPIRLHADPVIRLGSTMRYTTTGSSDGSVTRRCYIVWNAEQ